MSEAIEQTTPRAALAHTGAPMPGDLASVADAVSDAMRRVEEMSIPLETVAGAAECIRHMLKMDSADAPPSHPFLIFALESAAKELGELHNAITDALHPVSVAARAAERAARKAAEDTPEAAECRATIAEEMAAAFARSAAEARAEANARRATMPQEAAQ